MSEKHYGDRKLSYTATERLGSEGKRLQVLVFHNNVAVRRDLANSQPSRLLKRYEAFARSNIVAQKWLAEVMKDYWSYFERDRVDFVFTQE